VTAVRLDLGRSAMLADGVRRCSGRGCCSSSKVKVAAVFKPKPCEVSSFYIERAQRCYGNYAMTSPYQSTITVVSVHLEFSSCTGRSGVSGRGACVKRDQQATAA